VSESNEGNSQMLGTWQAVVISERGEDFAYHMKADCAPDYIVLC
jgi:hypothetical protein